MYCQGYQKIPIIPSDRDNIHLKRRAKKAPHKDYKACTTGTMKALNLLLLLLFSTLLNTAFSFSPPSLIVTQRRPSLIIGVKNRGASSTWKRHSCNRQRHGYSPLLWVTENGNKQDESLHDASFYIRKALYAGTIPFSYYHHNMIITFPF
jgi:hypothetical protein